MAIHVFVAQQLPTLLQTVSEINHRQLAKDELVKSVPIALRRLFRDLADLRAQFESAMGKSLETEPMVLSPRKTAGGSRFRPAA